jgi:hypothetical protein
VTRLAGVHLDRSRGSSAIQITTQAFQVQACARVSGVADPFNGHIEESCIA